METAPFFEDIAFGPAGGAAHWLTTDDGRALGLPEPYYLVAHSMGGCIGLRALQEGLPVKAVMFSAPMWGITMAPLLRSAAWSAATIARAVGRGDMLAPGQALETFVLREPFDTNTLTRDKEMFERLQTQMRAHPDLALGGPTLHWLYESMTEMNRLASTASPDLPCLTFLGTSIARPAISILIRGNRCRGRLSPMAMPTIRAGAWIITSVPKVRPRLSAIALARLI